jgi:hypothetical protein
MPIAAKGEQSPLASAHASAEICTAASLKIEAGIVTTFKS